MKNKVKELTLFYRSSQALKIPGNSIQSFRIDGVTENASIDGVGYEAASLWLCADRKEMSYMDWLKLCTQGDLHTVLIKWSDGKTKKYKLPEAELFDYKFQNPYMQIDVLPLDSEDFNWQVFIDLHKHKSIYLLKSHIKSIWYSLFLSRNHGNFYKYKITSFFAKLFKTTKHLHKRRTKSIIDNIEAKSKWEIFKNDSEVN